MSGQWSSLEEYSFTLCVEIQIALIYDVIFFFFFFVISVNSVCFAPHELGLILACGSSDGSISVLYNTGKNPLLAHVYRIEVFQ